MKTCSECKYWNYENGKCTSTERLGVFPFGHILKPEEYGCLYFDRKKEPEPEMNPARPIRISAETEQEAIMLYMMQKYEDRLRITSMEYNGLWASFTLSIQDEGDE